MSVAVPLPTRRATRRLGLALGQSLRPGDLLLLEGGLGAGKTFLARSICRALGVPASVTVTSPTFALVHEYEVTVGKLIHADLYRLDDARSVAALGLREAIGEGALALVEWGERFGHELGDDGLVVRLGHGDHGRGAELIARGERGRRLLSALG